MRVLAIGDIHSGLKALEQVLAKAKVTTEDKLIFLGDYVDGWSQATETINFLIDLQKTHNCVFIRGNHDEFCRSWLTERKDNPMWYEHGGEATVNSYAKLDKQTKELHIDFFTQLEDYYLDEDKRLFLHAGFTNLKGIDFEYFSKTFYWDRTLWELVLSLDPNLTPEHKYYPQRLTHYSEIYIGHTPVTRIGKTTPQNAANVWNVDTGAAFKGPLSIIDIATKQVWQSDPVYTLYPDEKGRN